MRNRLASRLALPLMIAALLAAGAPTAHAQQSLPETKLLQVILLSASRAGTSDLDDLPDNARKAVTDISAFLPFRAYEVLDASLIRSNSHGTNLMRGPDGAEYEIRISFAQVRDTENRATGRVMVRQFEVIKHPLVNRILLEPPRTDRSSDRSAPATAPIAARTLISTSFTAEIGNTTVVGSSRLNGSEEALVVLFTALP